MRAVGAFETVVYILLMHRYSSLFINTALLLWAFNIKEDPNVPIDTMNFSDTMNVRPNSFKAVFEPRVENLEELVEASMS